MTKQNDKTQASICCWNFNNVWIWSSQVSWFHYFHHQETAVVDVASFLFLLVAGPCHRDAAKLHTVVYCKYFLCFSVVTTLLLLSLSLCMATSLNPYSASQHSTPTLQACSSHPAFLCLNVVIAIAIDFALCCLQSILTAIAVDAHCMHCFWNPCGCCLLTQHRWLIVSIWIFISLGQLLAMWQMPHSTVQWQQCALLALHSSYFHHCLIVVWFCISPVAVVFHHSLHGKV